MSKIDKVEWEYDILGHILVKDCKCRIMAYYDMGERTFFYRPYTEDFIPNNSVKILYPAPSEIPVFYRGSLDSYDEYVMDWVNNSEDHLCNNVR